MNAPVPNPLLGLRRLGESDWLVVISRRMVRDGSLARFIEADGLAGLTSNPAIFAHAMMSDGEYAQPIERLGREFSSGLEVYEELAVEDLRAAAALLRPLYDATGGADGFVSLAVSPHLAADPAASLR